MAGGLRSLPAPRLRAYFFSSFFSFIGVLGVLGELAAPEEGVLVVPADDGGVALLEGPLAGSFLPHATSANAATTAQIRLVFIDSFLLKVGGKRRR